MAASKRHTADPFEIYCFARSFRDAASALGNLTVDRTEENRQAHLKPFRLPHRPMYPYPLSGMMIPSVVLDVFCIELFLKCLKQIRDGDFLGVHNLKLLFADLGVEGQADVRLRFNQNTPGAYDKFPITVESVLERVHELFVGLRYGFDREPPRMPADSNGNFRGNYGFEILSRSVRELIESGNPDWKERYWVRETLF